MLRDMLAARLRACLIFLFVIVGLLTLAGLRWVVAGIFAKEAFQHVFATLVILVFLASILLSGRIVQRLIPSAPRRKAHPSTDWADSE